VSEKSGQGLLLEAVRFFPELTLTYFLTGVLPRVSSELRKWERQLTVYADWPLLQQASASLSRKRFHAQGGSFYALYNFNPRYYKKLVSLIVALQTISDYLDNLCDRGGIYNEAAFRCLHRAMTAALTRGPIKGLDYYRFYPAKNDGGYLEALVAECRSCTGILPAYPAVQPEILRLASLYNDLQVYKHLNPAERGSRLKRWFKEKAAPASPPLHWWEYAAACGSTLAIFALFGLAASPETSVHEARKLVNAYFPWVCGLHILLDYWIDQEEDRREGDFNFAACYSSPALAVERLHLFLQKSLEEAAKLPRTSFHRSVIRGLLAVYLSDPKVSLQGLQEPASSLLNAGGTEARLYYRLCLMLRKLGVL
jgi:tetraprenyl-beta-curcumene synthase